MLISFGIMDRHPILNRILMKGLMIGFCALQSCVFSTLSLTENWACNSLPKSLSDESSTDFNPVSTNRAYISLNPPLHGNDNIKLKNHACCFDEAKNDDHDAGRGLILFIFPFPMRKK